MKEEIRALIDYRLQEAKEAREEAEILLERGKLRGALNRAYYSMFYATGLNLHRESDNLNTVWMIQPS